MTDAALQREREYGGHIASGVGIARAPYELALAEKGFGLESARFGAGRDDEMFNRAMGRANLERSQANDLWNQFTWLLSRQDRMNPQQQFWGGY